MTTSPRDALSIAAVATNLGKAVTAIGDAIRAAGLTRKKCAPYYCPTSGDTECCPAHSGWDVCCNRPDLHRPVHAD